jgi:hypothetical protein
VDIDSRAAQTVEDFDARSVDEADVRQIEIHSAPRSTKIGAFALEQGGPLRDEFPFEFERP